MKYLIFIYLFTVSINSFSQLNYNFFDISVDYNNEKSNNPLLTEIWIDSTIHKHFKTSRCVGHLITDNNIDTLVLNYNFYEKWTIKDIKIYISNKLEELPTDINKNYMYLYPDIYSNNYTINIKLENIDTAYIISEITLLNDKNETFISYSGNKQKTYGSIGWDGLKWVWYTEFDFLTKK